MAGALLETISAERTRLRRALDLLDEMETHAAELERLTRALEAPGDAHLEASGDADPPTTPAAPSSSPAEPDRGESPAESPPRVGAGSAARRDGAASKSAPSGSKRLEPAPAPAAAAPSAEERASVPAPPTESVHDEVCERAVELLQKRGELTKADIRVETGESANRVKRALDRLEREGVIARTGLWRAGARGGRSSPILRLVDAAPTRPATGNDEPSTPKEPPASASSGPAATPAPPGTASSPRLRRAEAIATERAAREQHERWRAELRVSGLHRAVRRDIGEAMVALERRFPALAEPAAEEPAPAEVEQTEPPAASEPPPSDPVEKSEPPAAAAPADVYDELSRFDLAELLRRRTGREAPGSAVRRDLISELRRLDAAGVPKVSSAPALASEALPPLRDRVLAAIREHPDNPKAIAERLGFMPSVVATHLRELARDGLAVKQVGGYYGAVEQLDGAGGERPLEDRLLEEVEGALP